MLTVAGMTCSISLTDAFTMLPCQGKCDQSYVFVPLKATPHKDKSLTVVIFLPNSVVILARISSKSRVHLGWCSASGGLFFYKNQKVSLLHHKKGEEYFVAIELASILLP